MWFGSVESVSQLAFTCGLAAARLFYCEFFYVEPGYANTGVHMFGILLLL